MITKEAGKILEENDKFITYQMNDTIYDSKSLPTWEYEDSNPDIVTPIKHPLFNENI